MNEKYEQVRNIFEHSFKLSACDFLYVNKKVVS